ncbi:MAG: 50S ribosomal protein L30 [Nitrososphaeria archaeon]
MPALLVLRIRGDIDVRHAAEDALERMNLRRRHNATLIPDTPEYRGMLQGVKDYVAWCPATREIVVELLRRRARTAGWRPLTEEVVREHGFSGFEEMADAIIEGKVTLHGLGWVKPYFALQPPRGGYKAPIKRHAREGGVLGLNEGLPALVSRMF